MFYFAVGAGILARKTNAVSVKRDISRPLIFRYAVRRAAAKFLPENFCVFFGKNIAVALAYPPFVRTVLNAVYVKINGTSRSQTDFRKIAPVCLLIRLFYFFGQEFLYSVHKLSSYA